MTRRLVILGAGAASTTLVSGPTLARNIWSFIHRRPLTHRFDGHVTAASRPVGAKAMLIDFNYDTRPLTGAYPLPVIGPLRLLRESRSTTGAWRRLNGWTGTSWSATSRCPSSPTA